MSVLGYFRFYFSHNECFIFWRNASIYSYFWTNFEIFSSFKEIIIDDNWHCRIDIIFKRNLLFKNINLLLFKIEYFSLEMDLVLRSLIKDILLLSFQNHYFVFSRYDSTSNSCFNGNVNIVACNHSGFNTGLLQKLNGWKSIFFQLIFQNNESQNINILEIILPSLFKVVINIIFPNLFISISDRSKTSIWNFLQYIIKITIFNLTVDMNLLWCSLYENIIFVCLEVIC